MQEPSIRYAETKKQGDRVLLRLEGRCPTPGITSEWQQRRPVRRGRLAHTEILVIRQADEPVVFGRRRGLQAIAQTVLRRRWGFGGQSTSGGHRTDEPGARPLIWGWGTAWRKPMRRSVLWDATPRSCAASDVLRGMRTSGVGVAVSSFHGPSGGGQVVVSAGRAAAAGCAATTGNSCRWTSCARDGGAQR
jgi:hypothetical protein